MSTALTFLMTFLIGGMAPVLASLGSSSTLAYEGESVMFQYGDQFQSAPIPEDEESFGVLAYLYTDEPPILLMVREEEGLREVASRANLETTGFLRGEIERALPSRYPNYVLKDRGNVIVDGIEAFYFDFEYRKDEEEDVAKQRFVVIPVTDDKAVYVSFQVRAFEFKRNLDYLEQVLESMSVS